MLNADVVPIGTQFIGHDARQCRANVLSHFGFGNIDHYLASGVDFKPNGWREKLTRIAVDGGFSFGN